MRQTHLFPSTTSEPIDPNHLRHRVWALAKAVRHVRIHSLRHTFASTLITQGENVKYSSPQLGYAAVTITLDRRRGVERSGRRTQRPDSRSVWRRPFHLAIIQQNKPEQQRTARIAWRSSGPDVLKKMDYYAARAVSDTSCRPPSGRRPVNRPRGVDARGRDGREAAEQRRSHRAQGSRTSVRRTGRPPKGAAIRPERLTGVLYRDHVDVRVTPSKRPHSSLRQRVGGPGRTCARDVDLRSLFTTPRRRDAPSGQGARRLHLCGAHQPAPLHHAALCHRAPGGSLGFPCAIESPGRPASEYGRLRHGDGGQGGGDRRWMSFMSPILALRPGGASVRG